MRGWSQGLLVAVALMASSAAAEDTAPSGGLRPLCADRPGKATPPCIVDAGHTQLEVGLIDFATTRGPDGRDKTYDLGAFELRRGLTRRAEVELAWTPVVVERDRRPDGDLRRTGTGDLTVGLRAALTDPDADGLAASVEPFVTAPTATHGLGAGGWTGGLMLPVAAPLPGGASLTATPQLQVLPNAARSGAHVAWSGAVGLAQPMGEASLGLELWGARDEDPAGATSQASLDVSAAWTPRNAPDLQWDGGLNAGLNHDTPDVEIYLGVSRRF